MLTAPQRQDKRRNKRRRPGGPLRRPAAGSVAAAVARRIVSRAMSIAAAQLEEHRTALTGHCYRMLGSAVDADDAVQETMVRAWRNLARFDGRAALRTWLFRIATNVCLDALSDRARRERPIDDFAQGTVHDTLEERART